MTVYLQDTDLTLHHGDCLEVLRTLPDRSVHACMTSPPFYGLRDYGTGEWEGGAPDCDHKAPPQGGPVSGPLAGTGHRERGKDAGYGASCGKCGARRVDQQIGLEETPDQWVERLVEVFREVRRVLRDDGTLWVEIGDSYATSNPVGRRDADGGKFGNVTLAGSYDLNVRKNNSGHKAKDLIGQPWLLAFALRADGWYLRSEIIWARPNPMPESVTDRPTKSHSTVFLLSKRARYFFDSDAIRQPHQDVNRPEGPKGSDGVSREDYSGTNQGHHGSTFKRTHNNYNPLGANARSVWQIPTEPTPFAHFATWPRKLVARMILAGTSERGCCPECGAPWVRETAVELEFTQRTHNATATKESLSRRGSDKSVPGRNHVTTLGWSPSCADTCSSTGPYTPVPCTVLDPFAGSGTTLLVARQHGRHSIGIELNQSYCELVRDRTSQQSLLADVS